MNTINVFLISLFALISIVLASTNPNLKQRLCATPLSGCGSSRAATDCNSWHGCKWVNVKGGIKCFYDPSCASGKPQATVAPTTSPTIPCRFPSAGCGSLSTDDCPGFNGCFVFNDQCLDGGCQETPSPTKAPTVCIDVPPEGCGSKDALRACEQYTCCTWIDAQYVCEFTPSTPAPVPSVAPTKHWCTTLGVAACKKKVGVCKVVGGKCAPVSKRSL